MKATPMKAGRRLPDPHTVQVFAIMSHGVKSIRDDVAMENLFTLFAEQGLTRVLVVNEKNTPVGVVSKTDLVVQRHLDGDTQSVPSRGRAPKKKGISEGLPNDFRTAEELSATMTVGELMTPRVHKVDEDQTIADACAVMTEHGLHGLPVYSRKGKPIGWVSATDVVRWLVTDG